MTGEVGRRWLAHIASPRSTYTTRAVPKEEVLFLVRSDYVRWIAGDLAPGGRILEAGCGSGKISLALAYLGHRVTTLDISPDVLAALARNRDRLSAEFGRPLAVETRVGDVEHMPLPDDSFDRVTSEGVLEHWLSAEARVAVLREMARVTRPGGKVVVFVPNGRHPLHPWWRLTRYPGFATQDEVPAFRYDWTTLVREMTEAGFAGIEADGIAPWSTLSVWPRWLPLRVVAALARRVLPEPRWLRRRMGFNLVAAGNKRNGEPAHRTR